MRRGVYGCIGVEATTKSLRCGIGSRQGSPLGGS